MYASQQPLRRKNSARLDKPFLSFDSLEPRCLLAGITFDPATGVVTVEGSANADFVQVFEASSNEIEVRFTGVDSQTYSSSDVTEVLFFARAGDDWFNNHTNVNSRAFGHEGNDFFIGGSGEDEFYGGDGVDRLEGNGGNDSLFGDGGDDALFGGEDDDRAIGGAGNDRIQGDAGDDLIIAGPGNDHVRGGSGNDELFGNEGHDRLFGGEGNDEAAGQGGDDLVFGDAGNDLIQGNAGQDQLLGGDGDDTLWGGGDNDILFGQAGIDSIRGGVGDDWISGGELNDSLFGDAGADVIKGDEGDDWIWGGGENDRISGNDGDDTILGETGNDRLWGNTGSDLLFGNEGNDNADGGLGDDTILGGDGADNLFGDDGKDLVFGNLGDDFLSGGPGEDRLIGHEGNDIVFGGLGDDFILGQSGSDFLAGQGDDDEIYGGADGDTIRGGTGADRLFGQEDDDYLNGEEGNDIVHGGHGADVLIGGEGHDDIYSESGDEVHGDDEDDDETESLPFDRPIGLSNRLTISFAPDGTSIFDQTSQLFSAFSSMFDPAQIQNVILDSFGAWAEHGNLDIGLVADSGEAFGSPGSSFGDPRFGDVRVGAMPMASDVFAIAIGQGDFVSGTWAGDILFNSNADFQDPQHFLAVALHEVGHVLGLKHTNNLESTMHRYSVRTDLAAVDIATFKELYGLRSLDANDDDDDVSINNDSIAKATEIKFVEGGGIVEGTYPAIVFGDISDPSDVDYFGLEAPAEYSGQITFQVVSEGISQLAPGVSLFDKDGVLVAQVDSTELHGDLISISVSADESEGKYFLKMDSGVAATTGSFSVIATLDERNTVGAELIHKVAKGREFLQLEQVGIAEYFSDPENFLLNDDAHSDDDIGTATVLQTEDGFQLATRYQHKGSLLDNLDVDTYKFKSLKFDSTKSYAMNVSVRAIDIGGMIPKARIHDESGTEIPSQVAVNEHGEFVIQVEQVESDTEYFLTIESDNLLPFKSGNYELTISHSLNPVVFTTYATGTVDSGTKKYHSLHVAESQVIQFAFEAGELPSNPNATIWATIYDQNGSIVYQSLTRAGERRTANTTFFKPGSYTIEIENAIGSSFAGLSYHLIGIDVGGPQGPVFSDPSDSPFETNSEGEYVYPENVVTKLNLVVVDGISSNQQDPPTDNPPVNIFAWYWGNGA